jgi:hypothetical protein
MKAWSPAAVVLTLAALASLAALPAAARRPNAPRAAKPAAPRPAAADTAVQARHLTVYYFHGNARCVSCRRIEAYSHEAIRTAFAKELGSGRLAWRVVNVEEKGNEHFVKDYALYTKSVVLVDETAGRQVRWMNLEKVWQLLQDKPGFLRYVQEGVRAYLDPKS